MENKELSERELALYNFVKDSKEEVTVRLIEKKLGKSYIGAIGILLSKKLIVKDKKKKEVINTSGIGNPYSTKYIKFYKINSENI